MTSYTNSPFDVANAMVDIWGAHEAAKAAETLGFMHPDEQPFWQDVATMARMETQSDEPSA